MANFIDGRLKRTVNRTPVPTAGYRQAGLCYQWKLAFTNGCIMEIKYLWMGLCLNSLVCSIRIDLVYIAPNFF